MDAKEIMERDIATIKFWIKQYQDAGKVNKDLPEILAFCDKKVLELTQRLKLMKRACSVGDAT